MKKITLILGLLVAVNILFAQERKEAMKEKVRAQIEEYKERLDLSEAQISQIKEVKEKYRPELEVIKKDDNMERSEKMRASADVMEKMENDMAGILTSAQLEEWKVIKKEIREKREERRDKRKGRRGGGR